tara:strand:- start:509 stop:733 length:225 start_codon:yes stop_codon:yes gene_type:complete
MSDIEIPTELLEKDPMELAESQQDIDKIIEYLKATRENIRAAEKSGKRITGKAARTKAEPVTQGSILDVLVKDV